jgi:hypothetical protein
MTTPIDVDEARKALGRVERASYSRAPPYFQSPDFATISAALDRLEELEANPQGVYIPEAREALNKLIRNKSVSLQEASFLLTAINRAEEVPALSMERNEAIRKARVAQLEAGHSDGGSLLVSLHTALDERDNLMAQLEKLQKLFCDKCVWEACGDCASCQKERADSVEAECDVLKARVKELEARQEKMGDNVEEWQQSAKALRAQLETALANQKVEGFTTSDNAYSQALDREFSLFFKLKTAKGLLRKANKYLSRVADSLPYSDTLAELGEDIPAFLSSKEGGE